MSRMLRERMHKQLEEVEGYLMLELPRHALQILDSRLDWTNLQFEASLLRGEAHRSLDEFRDALKPLEFAANLRPDDFRVAIALGWCYKRTNRLAQAIDALERAKRANPDEPILSYNLACYWSLAGNIPKSLEELGVAIALDPEIRNLISEETDFDRIRNHPDFSKLLIPSPAN